MDSPEAVFRAEVDPDVVDRDDLLTQRHIVLRQRVEGRCVEVAEQVADQPFSGEAATQSMA